MAVGNEHRRNLRPYILLFCFFWGLVLGFFSYLYMKTAAQRLEIIEVAEEKENNQKMLELENKKSAITQIDPFKKTEEIEKPPEVAPVFVKPEVKLIDEKIITPDFRQPPVIPNPRIDDMPGLTGSTANRPLKPIEPVTSKEKARVTDTPAPVKKKRNPFGDEGVILDNIAPPELDD